MSNPSDKSRRDGGTPLPRTNRPRPESARRRLGRRSDPALEPADTATPPPSSTTEPASQPTTGVATPPPRSGPSHVIPAAAPSDENASLLAERPTQLASFDPAAKRSPSGTLRHVTLEMATPSGEPSSVRGHGPSYLGSIIDGRYRIDGVLGRGGMGVVYRARHEVLDKLFAIKILLPTEDNDVVERFVNEARAATAIGNDHIVGTVDFGQLPDGSTYFVMEYLEGRTLSQRIKAEKFVPVASAVSIARQIAEAMSAAHRAGIVHRDLKPENIFLTKRDSEGDFVKLLDFGIAKMQARENKLTRAGTIFGTPHYMSPEQAAASEVDTRADIYSLGVMLYEMLAGQVPFDAENPMGLLTQHLYTPPVPLTSRESSPQPLSVDLDAVVLTCLAKQPSDRYASMDELLVDLTRIENGEPPAALARLAAQTDRKSSEALVRNARKRLRAGKWPWHVIVVAALLSFFGALATSLVFRTPARPEIAPPPPVPSVRVRAEPARAPQPARRAVALVFSPIDAEVFQNGKSLGGMPLTVPVPKGEVVPVEIRRDGFYPARLELDGSRPVVVAKLTPIPGVQPKVPVPAGETNDALRAVAAARAMLSDAGAWTRAEAREARRQPAEAASGPLAEPSTSAAPSASATPSPSTPERHADPLPSAAPSAAAPASSR
ncbi:MAG TPA: protein kinase [Polyangiaceae bacterium]|nr:protein kinase [Polyangiaceae bacterium]